MEQLHLVGCTPDLKGLIFSTPRGDSSGDFWVPLDDRLLNLVEKAATDRRRAGSPRTSKPLKPKSPSRLTPREMQARLRVGQTLAEVAAEAGVDEEWVARFAGPILAEQAQIVARALAATLVRPKLGPSRQPLGPSVARNLADRGIVPPQDVLASAWSAYQMGDGRWGLRFSYVSGGRTLVADWDYDAESGEVSARGRMAADLGFVEHDSRRPTAGRGDGRPPADAAGDGDAEQADQLRLLPASKSVAAVGRRAPKAAVTAPLPPTSDP